MVQKASEVIVADQEQDEREQREEADVGKLEIESGTGRNVNRVEKTWLCRCGHSKNKPYCDGSHRSAGFRSDP